MKPIIIIFLLLAMSSTLFSQEIAQSKSLTKEDYLRKSRHQKTAAWFLVGGGFLMVSTAATIAVADASTAIWRMIPDRDEDAYPHKGMANTFAIVGCLAIIASIPCFSEASKNKRKAKGLSVYFKPGKTYQLQNYCLVQRFVPGVSLKIDL